jgi:hypothetical protein
MHLKWRCQQCLPEQSALPAWLKPSKLVLCPVYLPSKEGVALLDNLRKGFKAIDGPEVKPLAPTELMIGAGGAA